MRYAFLFFALTLPFAGTAHAASPPATYGEVAALVARVEVGEVPAAEALDLVAAAPDAPLAGAALGRLYILRSGHASTAVLKYMDIYRGFTALNGYIADHQEDPLPRVWRAASAVETKYVLWSISRTRGDLAAAAEFCGDDPALPDQRPRCKLLLGIMAKDSGDLAEALRLWAEAFAADPTGPAGKEAARLLALFTG
jgi:hypothetical protein